MADLKMLYVKNPNYTAGVIMADDVVVQCHKMFHPWAIGMSKDKIIDTLKSFGNLFYFQPNATSSWQEVLNVMKTMEGVE